ncbi:MAG: hypothetical protein Rubg2KO_02070 [Rubricoccaceae bacterium]
MTLTTGTSLLASPSDGKPSGGLFLASQAGDPGSPKKRLERLEARNERARELAVGFKPDLVLPDELASLRTGLGAHDALNLDDGSSSAIVVRRGDAWVQPNRPTGDDVEREVATALGAFCDGT